MLGNHRDTSTRLDAPSANDPTCAVTHLHVADAVLLQHGEVQTEQTTGYRPDPLRGCHTLHVLGDGGQFANLRHESGIPSGASGTEQPGNPYPATSE